MKEQKQNLHPTIQLIESVKEDFPGIFEEIEEFQRKNPILSNRTCVANIVSRYSVREGFLNSVINTLLILKEFRKTKIMYSFSDALHEAFSDNGDTIIMKDVLLALPFRTFYLEYQRNSYFEGLLVHYDINAKGNPTLNFLILIPMTLRTRNIEVELTGNLSIDEIVDEVYRKEKIDTIHSEPRINLIWGLNAIFYLCTKNCVIKENEEQQQIYKKHAVIRDDNTEIRKWDVGYREINDGKSKKVKSNHCTDNLGTIKKRPREHMRRAHFHHYWCGPGRTRLEVRFILETSVNKNQEVDELPVVNRKN